MNSRTTFVAALLAGALAAVPAMAGPIVYPESAMVKVRPQTPVGTGQAVNLTAAKNELVSFQVVVNGANTGVAGVTGALAGLSGPGTIGAPDVTLYRVGMLNISTPTPPNTATGLWPDPLIPDVDEIAGEKRNAFPFNISAGESRAIWVDIHVPMDAAPGQYQGTLTVSGSNLSAQVPVNLTVVDVVLPSTPSLATAFLLYKTNVCLAHGQSSDCDATPNGSALLARYQTLALEHRFTVTNPFSSVPSGDWTAWDARHAPFLDGTTPSRLPGARMTTAQYPGARDATQYAAFTSHFQAKGWLDRAFDYTADEPPYGVSFATAASQAQLVQQAAPALRKLITTTYQDASTYGLLPYTDLLVPPVNWIDGAEAPYMGDQRALYDGFVQKPQHGLWLYESCMSQGCAAGSSLPESKPGANWPSYMVDASAARNRAMQWVDFRERATGELYYETGMALPTAWTDQRRFNGNGDGTLFYPGTPAIIGGTTDVPVASVRMKMIRAGVQDFEWLKMVSDAGDPAFARATAAAVFPTAHEVGDDGSVFESARAALIARLLQLKGLDAPPGLVQQAGGFASGSSSPLSASSSNITAHGQSCAAAPGLGFGSLLAWGLWALRRRKKG